MSSSNTNNTAYVGTEVKYLVNIESCGFDMVTDDFEITIKRGTTSRVFHKSDLIEEVVTVPEERHYFYLCFDTAYFGPGVLTCIVTAYVPDTDFPDGLRTEIDKFDLLTSVPL